MLAARFKRTLNTMTLSTKSMKDAESLFTEAESDAQQINEAIEKSQIVQTEIPKILIDYVEVDRMQKENDEMELLLSDYHRGVELMMESYRKRMLSAMEITAEEVGYFDTELVNKILEQSDQIYKMHCVMRKAANAGETAENCIAEEVVYLRKENDTLRDLFEIAQKFGTAQFPIKFNSLQLKEVGVQTQNEQEDTSDEEDDKITVIDLKLHETSGCEVQHVKLNF